jgi:hypothetical protein
MQPLPASGKIGGQISTNKDVCMNLYTFKQLVIKFQMRDFLIRLKTQMKMACIYHPVCFIFYEPGPERDRLGS